MTVLEAMRDPDLFARWFEPAASWRAWRAFLGALFGLELDAEEREIFERFTGRKRVPGSPAREAWVIVGRRGGKSRVAALVAVWLACFRDYSAVLAPGERGVVMLLAADRAQARVLFRYVRAFIARVPMLARLLERETSEELDLSNGVTIAVHTASFRTTRGYTLIAVLADEVAFWHVDDEGASPDAEVIAAVRPGMATVPGALLLGISSPYARRGVLWDAHRRHFGRDEAPVLVWKADTRAMNPTVPVTTVEEAYAQDEARARAEYGAEFRSDVETFLDRDAIAAATVVGRRELAPVAGEAYQAFVDPSGGSSDAMTLAIAHESGQGAERRAVLDVVREVRPPFSPDAVVEEFAEVLRCYGVARVTGDRYGAEWVAERFRKAGLVYVPAERAKSEIYRELLPAVNSRRVELLEVPRLMVQLCALERRTARGGRDSIDHPPGGHDDVANAVAGAIDLVLGAHGWDFGELMDALDEAYKLLPAELARREAEEGGRDG